MKRAITFAVVFVCMVFGLGTEARAQQKTWRSSLYPKDWHPGYKDAEGRFLHDFSHAGYHRGEVPIPRVKGPVFNVTRYGAVPDDKNDDRAAIQAAIDAAGKAGGGVVYLPQGTFYLKRHLAIRRDKIVVRGDGTKRTRLVYNGPPLNRIIRIGSGDWTSPRSERIPATADIPSPSFIIPLERVSDFNVGDRVVIHCRRNEKFIADLGNHPGWVGRKSRSSDGILYYREITGIDKGKKTITIDTPTRYGLKTAYRTEVYKAGKPLEEVGIEDFSIAMWEIEAGKVPYLAPFFRFDSTCNCWMRNVRSYAPPENTRGLGYPEGNAPEDVKFHLHSHGLNIYSSRFVTVDNCHFANPIPHGGGQGYMFAVYASNDVLIKNSSGYNGRHNFSIASWASGIVLHNCTSGTTKNCPPLDSPRNIRKQRLGDIFSCDFHMDFAHACLIDNHNFDGGSWIAGPRPPFHGVSVTESVFWNTNMLRPAIHYWPTQRYSLTSDQWGWGYVIGIRGPVKSKLLNLYRIHYKKDPGDLHRPDFVEPATLAANPDSGDGRGETLEPQSLYLDQLERRLSKRGKRNPGSGREAGRQGGEGKKEGQRRGDRTGARG